MKGKEEAMRSLAIVLIVLSALGFVLAVISSFMGPITDITPEGFSRGCSNLALIAIALGIWLK
jgi:hypothetical protein